MEKLEIKQPELIKAFRWLQENLSTMDHGNLSLELNIYHGEIGTVAYGREERKRVSR
jgi:hypothetical protein